MKKMKLITTTALIIASLSAYALTPGSGTWVKETTTYGTPNLQDAYVYVPSNASPAVLNGKRALMLTLHGCGQTASGNVTGKKFNWETTAEQYGMVVIAPTVPSGTSSTRSSSGCWDWFGTGWTRTNRDQVPLKKLLDAVIARSNLDIDPNQIYVTGLSSGAAETHVLGCVFPDYFAGVGVNAGPALGSSSTAIFSEPTITAAQVASNCKAGNGNQYNSYFNTQVWNTIYGSGDTMVKPGHNVRNGHGTCVLYGMTTGSTCNNGEAITVAGGGSGNQYRDANGKLRVSVISVNGMAHAWPAGSGGSGGGSYVDYTHVNYPVWITNWFFSNNLRVGGGSSTTTTSTTSTTGGATTTTTTVATTTTTTAGACYTSSNYAHVTAGRATQSLGYVYAKGSSQNMGLYNTYATNKLRMTGTNYYIIDSTCP